MRFSRISLGVIVLIFVAVGSYFLYRSHAATGAFWNGDFETGDLSQFSSQFCSGTHTSNPPTGISIVNSPVRSGSHAAKISVDDTSIHGNCSNVGSPQHPNAQIFANPPSTGINFIKPGDDYYFGFSYLFPSGFKACNPYWTGCFFQLEEVYGPPYGGAPPVGALILANGSGNQIYLNGSAPSGYNIWKAPTNVPQDGTHWVDMVIHEHFETCGDTKYPCGTGQTPGYVEIWYGDTTGSHPLTQQNTMINPSTLTYTANRFYTATLQPNTNWDGSTPNHFAIQNYRGGNNYNICPSGGGTCTVYTYASNPTAYDTTPCPTTGYTCFASPQVGLSTIYVDDVAVGTSLASVIPGGGSTPPPPTVTLTANPTTINSGQSSTLTWSSTNATSCSATTPSGWTSSTATSGTQSVSPTTTTTYTITCTGTGGSTPATATVTVNPSSITGDLNNDGHVNIFDLSIFLTHWQQTGSGIPEDFNNDGVVNILDLSILLSHYGT